MTAADPASVACPYCHAAAGEACRDFAGGRVHRTHAKRIKAAEVMAANPSLREQEAARAAERVSVNRVALEAFIAEADSLRAARDSEFLCSRAEHEQSQVEADAYVKALDITPIPAVEG